MPGEWKKLKMAYLKEQRKTHEVYLWLLSCALFIVHPLVKFNLARRFWGKQKANSMI